MVRFRISPALAFLLTLAASIATAVADEAPVGQITTAQASKLVEQLGIDIKPSSEAKKLEGIWVEGNDPVEGSISLDIDGQGKIRSIEPFAPIPADRLRYLSREALHSFALRWNGKNAGKPEYLEMDKSGIFYLTVTYPHR